MSYFNQITANFNPANQSAFGTLEVGELSPSIQGDFVYGLNTQTWITPVTSGTGATVDTNAGRLRLQCGTSGTSYAYITTRRPIRYRAGQGTLARFTPLFSTGIANNTQLWGMGTIASNAPYDGYFFGFIGTTFGIAHYNAGSLVGGSIIAQANWNGDKVDGSAGTAFNWDPTLGTPVMIKYPFLGYGDIFFYVENPSTGAWVLVHTIRYANSSASIQLSNPTLNFVAYTANSGNTTNKTMYCGSVGVFVSGYRSFIGNPKWAFDAAKTGVTTESLAFSLKNCTSYNGVTNRGLLRFNSISYGTNSNTYGAVRFRLGATITGTPVYNPINGTSSQTGGNNDGVTLTAANSITSADTAGALTAGSGTYLWGFSIGANSNGVIDLSPFNIFLAPTEILSVSVYAANSLAINVSLTWTEDI